MTTNLPPANTPCTTYWWCNTAHPEGGPHRRNLDLIEHLDNSACLIEVNMLATDEGRFIEVMFTDMDGTDVDLELPPTAAGTLGRIVELFDRRGLREFGHLLAEGAVMLNRVTES